MAACPVAHSSPHRRIVIPDVEESVFRLFLDYLYGSKLNTSQLPTDTLMELMAVADRYGGSNWSVI